MEAALATVLASGSLSQAQAGATGVGSGRNGWLRFFRELFSPRGLKSLAAYPVRLGLLGYNLPFGVILAMQFLVSLLVALAFLYALRLLTLKLF
jgi:hypothetical protein